MSGEYRRWYDNDPILKEALELLKMQTDDTKSAAADFIISMQEQAAQEVIERIYQLTQEFSKKGNRWYDSDPVMLKAIEMLRMSSPKTQRIAALKLLLALENNTLDSSDSTEHE